MGKKRKGVGELQEDWVKFVHRVVILVGEHTWVSKNRSKDRFGPRLRQLSYGREDDD